MIKVLLIGVVGSAAGVLAGPALDGGGSSTVESWVARGVLGTVIAGFILKQLVPGWLYSDVKTENKELRAENVRLVQLVLDTQQKTIPAIEAATKVVEEAMTEIRVLRRGGS